MEKLKAPFADFNGNDIYEGYQIQHPEGSIAKVVYDTSFKNHWRAVYVDGESCSLALQLGDLGRAVVMEDKANEEVNNMVTKVEAFKANDGTLHETEEAAIKVNDMMKEVDEKHKLRDIIKRYSPQSLVVKSLINWLYDHNVRVVEVEDL